MKELSGTARNFNISLDSETYEKKIMVEMILVLSEPVFCLTADGLSRERISETVRFGMSQKSLKVLMETLSDINKEMEKIGAKNENNDQD